MHYRRYLISFVVLVLWATATNHSQSQLRLTIVDGRVSLLAQNVSVRAVVEEWKRVSGVTIVNGERLDDVPPVTLQLIDVPEREALATLLRGVGGYVVTQRADSEAIDRIVILQNRAPVNELARAADPVFQVPEQPALQTTERASTTDGPEAAPVRDLATAASSAEPALSTAAAAAPAGAQRGSSTPFPRINSSDLVDPNAVNPTLIPPELRPPTTIFVETAGSSARPGAITTIGPPPPGVIYRGPTDPNALKPQSAAPTPSAPRK